jgi:hypothetical protein
MARAPSRPRPPRAPTYAESRPLKPDELARLGYSPTSGRRVARTVKRITKTTKTWSECQTVQAGKGGMTKEAFTRDVASGRRAYADAATAKRQRQAQQARELLQDFPRSNARGAPSDLRGLSAGTRGRASADEAGI